MMASASDSSGVFASSGPMTPTVITGARLIDGTGATPVEDATLVIVDGRVQAVGRGLPVPDGARTIRAAGRTVMPGLIDSHVHNMGLKAVSPMPQRPPRLALIQAIQECRGLLKAGYTTLKDCGCRNGIFLKKASEEGSLPGIPRIVAAGLVVAQTFNGLDNAYLPDKCLDARSARQSEFLLCDGVDECIKGTRYALRYGADFVKIFASGNYAFDNSPADHLQFNADEIRAVVRTAADAGKFVTAHCHSRLSAKNALLCGVKTIDHAIGIDEGVVGLAKERDALFVSTLSIVHAEMEQARRENSAMASPQCQDAWVSMISSYKAVKNAGGVLAAGSDLNSSPTLPLGRNALELELLVDYCDFTPMEAIVAATRNGALACFMGHETGTLEPGKLADLIIVDGDPLLDIRILQDPANIKLVMLEGAVEVDHTLGPIVNSDRKSGVR